MSADDQPIAITLTVRQWREIQADLDLDPQVDAIEDLLAQLDEYDLAGGCTEEDCSCGGAK